MCESIVEIDGRRVDPTAELSIAESLASAAELAEIARRGLFESIRANRVPGIDVAQMKGGL